MIYVTGDTHIPVDISKISTRKFSQQKSLSAEDYVIICGDFGGIWDNGNEEQYWLKWLTHKEFTTLFVDGNHENHQMLNENFPIVQFHEGKAHKINDKIFHLMRGQVFTMNVKRYLQWAVQAPMIKNAEKKGRIGGHKKCHLTKSTIMPQIILNYMAGKWIILLLIVPRILSSIKLKMDMRKTN